MPECADDDDAAADPPLAAVNENDRRAAAFSLLLRVEVSWAKAVALAAETVPREC